MIVKNEPTNEAEVLEAARDEIECVRRDAEDQLAALEDAAQSTSPKAAELRRQIRALELMRGRG